MKPAGICFHQLANEEDYRNRWSFQQCFEVDYPDQGLSKALMKPSSDLPPNASTDIVTRVAQVLCMIAEKKRNDIVRAGLALGEERVLRPGMLKQ